jgi:hypothetical protein
MSIEQLKRVLQPPPNPREVPRLSDWLELEDALGCSLPDDYRRFIEVYGTGRIAEFLSIFNPFSAHRYLNLREQLRIQAQVLEELESFGEVLPYKIHPVPGGVFPFGATDNGDVMFWVCDGIPDNWHVVVNASRSPDWERFDEDMTAFLTETLCGGTRPSAFPGKFPPPAVRFESIV